MGLNIAPDLDTVMYSLAGVANSETGWGRQGESWRTFDEAVRLGGPQWFRLGDLDLATHLVRSEALASGRTLTDVTQQLQDRLGVTHPILPMSDGAAPTMIESAEGLLSFQTWFVEKQWRPAVRAVRLPDDVRTTPAVLAALEKANVVIIAPSNPFVSIDPILNAYPLREMVTDLPQLVVAVSPIIGGRAVKGPAAKMMRELGMPATAQAVAAYYNDLIDLFVFDRQDQQDIAGEERPHLCVNTLMVTRSDRLRLAQVILDYV